MRARRTRRNVVISMSVQEANDLLFALEDSVEVDNENENPTLVHLTDVLSHTDLFVGVEHNG